MNPIVHTAAGFRSSAALYPKRRSRRRSPYEICVCVAIQSPTHAWVEAFLHFSAQARRVGRPTRQVRVEHKVDAVAPTIDEYNEHTVCSSRITLGAAATPPAGSPRRPADGSLCRCRLPPTWPIANVRMMCHDGRSGRDD